MAKEDATALRKRGAKKEQVMREAPDDIPDEAKTRLRQKKQLPSVAYLLAHGDPETAHLPKTTMQIVGYPVVLALIFGISLLIFHHAPHHLSTHPGFKVPKAGRRPLKKRASGVPVMEGVLKVEEPIKVEQGVP